MKIKSRRAIITLISLLGFCLLGLLLIFAVPLNGTATASAAGTPRYNIYFDYKYYSGSSMGTAKPTPRLVTEKTNVLKSDEHLYKYGKKCQVEFEIYGSYYDDTTGTLPQGGTIKSKEVTIVAISEYEGNFFTIKDASGNVVAKNTISYVGQQQKIEATLSDGMYYVEFRGETDWEQESPVRTVSRIVKIECTFSFKIDYHVHSYTSTVTKPTCTTEGYTTHRCSCGDSYTDNRTSALGHSYSATTTPPTCTSGGYTTNRCTRCGNTYQSNQSDALGHSYDSTTTPPTCTEEGYTTHVCSRCKTTYVDSRIPALGHSYTVETSATCTGEKFVYTCSRCHYTYTDYTNENGTGHSFTTKTTAATCTEAGYTVYTCTKCGYSYRDTVSNALGHNYRASVVSPGCTTVGYTLYTCSRCGSEYRSGETAASGHNYVERTYPATCTEGSYTLHECSRCGDSYRDNISQPLGHNFVTSEIPPTCTEGGKTVQKCQVCDYEISESDGSLPTGHDYTSTTIRAATCTEEGLRRSVCDICGYSYETRIPAVGHNYQITDVKSSNGNTRRTYTCSVCGDSYVQELGDQYEEVSNYVEYLFQQYQPYMIWVFLATAGVWSIAIGVALIIAHKNEDKEKAKKMLVNYVVGLVVIFCIIVACPFLVRGIASLVT